MSIPPPPAQVPTLCPPPESPEGPQGGPCPPRSGLGQRWLGRSPLVQFISHLAPEQTPRPNLPRPCQPLRRLLALEDIRENRFSATRQQGGQAPGRGSGRAGGGREPGRGCGALPARSWAHLHSVTQQTRLSTCCTPDVVPGAGDTVGDKKGQTLCLVALLTQLERQSKRTSEGRGGEMLGTRMRGRMVKGH